MNKSILETVVGMAVIALAVFVIIVAYEKTGVFSADDGGYILRAKFDKVDGLNVGSPVKISGITVGKVVSQSLDKKTYAALIEMKLNDDVKLPSDTSAEIAGLGIMSDKYISIIPGADDQYLNEGDNIEFTQSAISLEALIGKFVFGSASSNKNDANHDEGDKTDHHLNRPESHNDVDALQNHG